MKVVHISGLEARCEARGIERDTNLMLLADDLPKVGDFVLVHVGYAIQKMSAADADTTWRLFDEVLAALPSQPSLSDTVP
jgi:hydrogenase expression/formation protein HypC